MPGALLVCFALPDEAAPFRRRMSGRTGVRVLVTGIGQRNAEHALRASLRSQRPAHVLTCGYAGALNPELAHGMVIFSTDPSPLLRSALLSAGAQEGIFLCAERIAGTALVKQELRHSSGADAVEMESGVIREMCRAEGIASATVRAISDTAQEDLPLDFNTLMTQDQRLDYARLAAALVRDPGKVPALLQLRKQTRHAAHALATVLEQVASQLQQVGSP